MRDAVDKIPGMSWHEARKAKQIRISEPHSEDKPSEVTEVYWIYALRKEGDYPEPTPRSGKWLIFVPAMKVDEVWAKIKRATEEGKLGGSSKVATAKPISLPSQKAKHPEIRVICVYTYDWADEVDVRRIREELRRLGITWKIPYKADEDTIKGRYGKGVSKYYL